MITYTIDSKIDNISYTNGMSSYVIKKEFNT